MELGILFDLSFLSADTASVSDIQDELTKTIAPIPVKKYALENFFPCNPRAWLHRYFMLVLMCFLSFGSYYVYDNPAALQKTITKVLLGHTHFSILVEVDSLRMKLCTGDAATAEKNSLGILFLLSC